jgi:lactobin A/cerein 7B family class IIb bacteriocin
LLKLITFTDRLIALHTGKRVSKSFERVDDKLIFIFMGNLNPATYGVEKMNEMEMNETNGGLAPIVWLFIGIAVGEMLDRGATGDFRDGYNAFNSCM